MSNKTHASFEHINNRTIDSLNMTIDEYRHTKTGAQHIHLSADNSENVFLVALRTVPQDSTGVAHILEHTALCGSEKYPVRDPFFMMIRRSLNTFMNAFTSSDWTAYPFASQNRKDFDNLLGVYLDAVFFSRLDPLDFAQEGHRLDFTETGNTDSPLMYKGVVYNEMKGAMSSVPSQLWQVLNKYIFPTSTYHHNSGGEPIAIPELSYQQLKQFYQTHYHPSNAIFMTFGDIPAAEHQEKFETLALNRFDKLDKIIQVKPEQRYFAPIRVEESYAYQTDDSNEDASKKSHIVVGWLLDSSIDLQANLECHLLSSLLYDNSASPLQHILETSDLGSSPSPLCGMDDSQYEMMFIAGLEGCADDSAIALEQQLTDTLNTIVRDGLPQSQIEASLHQLELQQREIGGDGYPYGLQLILNALSPATHRGDILSFMDLETALASLRTAIQERDYIPKLVQRLLIDNPHRVTLTLKPNEHIQQRQTIAEEAKLAAIKAGMSDTDKQALVAQAKALEERQQQEEDMELLPEVTLADIPAATPLPQGTQQALQSHQLTHYSAGTNGLSYQQIVCPIPALSPELLHALPYYTHCLTEMGIGKDDYLSVQQQQSEVVGSINSYYSLRNHVDDPQRYQAHITLSAKALSNNQRAMSQLMSDTLSAPRFDESERLVELVAQAKAGREQSITGNGHGLAMQAAAANLNPTANAIHNLMGLASIQTIKQLHQQLQAGNTQELQRQLSDIHQQVLAAEKHWLLVSEAHSAEQQLTDLQDTCAPLIQQVPVSSTLQLADTTGANIQQAWICNSQVHFCARAYPTVTMSHADAAPLAVLGGVLRNGFLHRAIREQGGAYGGGASQDNNSACFRFYSYRDPRMGETLNDFDRAIAWLNEHTLEQQAIQESILGVIGSMDKPGSPAGEAKQAFHSILNGRTQEKRDDFRQRIINVNADDLYRVAETYLKPEHANTAVVTGKHGVEEAQALGLELIDL